MNIINNIVAVETPKYVANSRAGKNYIDLNMDRIAEIGLVMPRVSLRDHRKLSWFMACIKNAAIMGDEHLTNSDRVKTLTTAIAKVGKLNPGVLDNPELKDDLISMAWVAYAKLERHGVDNAHYLVADLPCDDRQTMRPSRGIGLDYTQYRNKTKPVFVDSKYPDSQWNLLATAELFNSRETLAPAPLDCGDSTPCRAESRPLPTSKPFDNLEWHPELSIAAPVSPGLCKVKAEPMPAARAISKEFNFGGGGDWENHPRAMRLENSDKAIADNLKWLASLK